jgi:hypothetical protein
MKNQIISKAKQLELSNHPETKKFGKIIIKYANNFQCYYCLDTAQCWRPRNTQFWASMDGRGSYDITRCTHCNDGGWVRCAHSNFVCVNGIQLFKRGDTNVDDRINELKNVYRKKIEEPEAEWWLYEKKVLFQKTKEVEIQVNVKKLADIVLSSIRLQVGDLSSIATLAKNLTIDMSSTLTKENDETEVMRQEKNEKGQTVYLIMRLEKKKKDRTLLGNAFKSRKFTFSAKYMILVPKNDIAVKKCNELMNNEIENRIDNYEF